MPDTKKRVVVGIDGSENSIDALRCALEEASLRGALLHVIYAFTSPTAVGVPVPADYYETLQKDAHTIIDESIASATEGFTGTLPEIARTVVPEAPGAALVDASEGAELVVVGSRGRGGFSSLLIGSVSTQCVYHAHCPVLVVRPRD